MRDWFKALYEVLLRRLVRPLVVLFIFMEQKEKSCKAFMKAHANIKTILKITLAVLALWLFFIAVVNSLTGNNDGFYYMVWRGAMAFIATKQSHPKNKKASPKTSLFYPYKPSQLERIIFTRPTALKELTGDFEHHRA